MIETKAPKEPEYLKIGDQIFLTLSIKVFTTDIEAAEETKKLTEQGKLHLLDERNPAQSAQLQKITDDPEFEYKGVMYCEGVNNLSL